MFERTTTLASPLPLTVRVSDDTRWTTLYGDAPFNGKATTSATFSAPGDYVLHVAANDLSGDGRGEQCCWTFGTVRVKVTQ